MKYDRFEDLPVWKGSIDLARSVHLLMEDAALGKKYSLRDQIERAALSISNNIAEGFERGTTKEVLTFLYIARGSAAEVRSMLCFVDSLPAYSHLKSHISNLKSEAESISRQLRAWADALQKSHIKGQRYLNETKRTTAQTRKTQ